MKNFSTSNFLFSFAGFLIAMLLFSTSAMAQTAQVRGRAVNTEGEPLVGATIFIPAHKLGAYTNEDGIFSVSKIPAGTIEVIGLYFGYDTTRVSVEVEDGKIETIRMVFESRIVYADEVQIVARQVGRIEKTKVDLGKVEITAEEISLLPSLGSPDLAQYLQVLPGVVFTGDQGGQLYIRGGTPIQNLTLLDGMYIYSPFHSIGLFSVFDPDYIRSADVYSAAFPAEFGGRVSSVIDINTRNGNLTGLKGKVNINPFTAGFLLEGPLGKSKNSGGGTSFILSARNNFMDQTSTTFYPYVDDSVGLPYNFLDIYGKLTFSDGVNFANLFGFRQTDNVNFDFPADIGWEAFGGGANFSLLPSQAAAIISGNFAYSRYETSLRSQSETFPRNSGISGFNGGLNMSYILNSVDELSFGVVFLGFATDYTFTNSFGFITEQQANNTEAALYGKYKKVIRNKPRPGEDTGYERAVIEPSVRLHYFNDQTEFAFEPRLRAKLNFPGVSLSAATGMFTQNLMSATSDRDVVNLFQGFLSAPSGLANRIKDHNLQTAWHAVTGIEAEIMPNLSTQVEGWYKDFTQLTNINREKLFPEDPNFITETGLAYGLDLVMKYRTSRLYIYGNYGWAKVTRDDMIRVYPTVFDRRHTANLVVAFRGPKLKAQDENLRSIRPKFNESKWEASLRWTIGSGFPFTQTQGYFEKLDFLGGGAQTDVTTQNGNLGILLSEELNTGRLPYYHRLDLSAKRRWLFGNAFLVEINASLINAYDRDNIFFFDRVRFEAVYQLPVIPSLGLTMKF